MVLKTYLRPPPPRPPPPPPRPPPAATARHRRHRAMPPPPPPPEGRLNRRRHDHHPRRRRAGRPHWPAGSSGCAAAPVAGRRSPGSMNRCRSWAGRPLPGVETAARVGPRPGAFACRPGAGRWPISALGSGPLAALALLKVTLVIALVDIAVPVGQDVVLPSRRPHFGLSRPGRLGRPGFGLGSGGLAGPLPAGRQDARLLPGQDDREKLHLPVGCPVGRGGRPADSRSPAGYRGSAVRRAGWKAAPQDVRRASLPAVPRVAGPALC